MVRGGGREVITIYSWTRTATFPPRNINLFTTGIYFELSVTFGSSNKVYKCLRDMFGTVSYSVLMDLLKGWSLRLVDSFVKLTIA